MILSTILNLVVTPVLYVIIASLEDRFLPSRHGGNGNGEGSGETAVAPTETPATI
jgi:hypothetical protein